MKARVKKSIIDFTGRDKAEKAIVESWSNFRSDLANGVFPYNDIINAKKSNFLKVLDETLKYDRGFEYIDKQLSDICKEFCIGRGGILAPNEPPPSINRLLPKSEFIKDDNRFSPKGIEWLYLAIGGPKDENGIKNTKLCSQAECRAKKGDRFAFCQFNSNHDCKVADLTIGTDKSFYHLNRQLEKAAAAMIKEEASRFIHSLKKPDSSKIVPHLNTWRMFTYCKLLSDQIFVPIETNNKSLMYAPFHCVAQYFLSLGYKGIVYKSTVFDKGKNLVLFDKNLVTLIGEIEEYII